MRSILLALAIAMLAPDAITAQDYAMPAPPPKPATPKKDPRPLKDRLWFGGGVVLMFGTVTNLGVAPVVGYKIDQQGKWSAGIGANYYYFSDSRYVPAYESSNYGGSLFTRYRIIPQAYLHAEYNAQNYELYNPFSDIVTREWVPFLLVGGGVAQPVGGGAFITFQILWDVILDERSPDGGQPWITGGVGIGF